MQTHHTPARLDGVFAALGDPTRRAIVSRLATQPGLCVSEIAGAFPLTMMAVSKHLTVLERAGLIRREKTGRERHCHLQPEALVQAASWIEDVRAFWEPRLDRLALLVESDATGQDLTLVMEQSWPPHSSTSPAAPTTGSRSSEPSAPPSRKSSQRGRRPRP